MPVRLRLVACAVICACLLGLTAVASAADWPQFRGPTGQGTSPDKGLPVAWSEQNNILWKAELPGAGASTPITLGDRVFLTSYAGFNVPGQPGEMDRLKRHVLALSLTDGKLLWSKEVPPKLPDSPKVRDDHGYASSTSVVDSERLYVFFGRSGVFAFSLDGSRQLWQADVGDKVHGWGTAASLLLSGDLLIVNASVESESLVALDKRTGIVKWRVPGIKDSWNTPILVPAPDGRSQLVVAIMGKVLSFDPASGRPIWSCNTNIPWYMVPSLVSNQGVVYCVGGRGESAGSLAIRLGGAGDVTASHRLWKTTGKGTNVPSPIFHEGYLYWAHENGTACCADAKNGQMVYEEPLPRAGAIYPSPVLADGKLYYVNRSGRTFVLAATPQFQLLATNDLGRIGAVNASPAVANGKLLLRSDKFLFCIGQK